MVIRGVVSALLSSVVVLCAGNIWGVQALVPFTVGELVGALIALLALTWTLRWLRNPKQRTVHTLSNPDRGREISESLRCRDKMSVDMLARSRAVGRREGQVSPYFPGIRAWSYLSCPPLRHQNRSHGSGSATAPAGVIVLDYNDLDHASACSGLLPAHVSVRPHRVS